MNVLNKVVSMILVFFLITTSVVVSVKAETADEIILIPATENVPIETSTEYEGVEMTSNVYGPFMGGNAVGAWAKYDNIDFGDGEIKDFLLNIGVNNDYAGGIVSVYIDDMTSAPVAIMNIEGTGGWNNYVWQSTPVNNSEIVGVHTVYLVLSGRRSLGNVKAFSFSKYSTETVSADVPSDIAGTEYEKIYTILSRVGIVDYEEGKAYSASKKITAEELLKMGAGIMNMSKDAQNIEYLSNQTGILMTDDVNFDTAAKLAAYILGYGEIARLKPDYSAACSYYAQSTNVFKNVSTSRSILTRGGLLQLAYNILETEVAVFDEISTTSITRHLGEETVLNYYHDVWIDDGVVDGNMYTNLTGPASVSDGYVLIDKITYKEGSASACNMLGRRVQFYYREDGGERQLIFIEEYNNEFVVLDDEDVISYSNRTLKYHDENDKSRSLKLNKLVDFIYNHGALLSYNESILKNFNGTVTFIDNNGDGEYEIIEMYDTYDIVVDYISDEVIYELYGNNKLDIADSVLIVKDQYGNVIDETELQRLTSGNVVTVAKGSDLKGSNIIEIKIARKNTSGTVESVDDDGEIVLNGKTYSLSKLVKYSTKDIDVCVGDNVIFYLNAEGEIALVHFTPMPKSYGYLVAVGQKGSINKAVQIKVFSQDSTIKVYDCAKSVKIDDKTYRDRDEAYTLINTLYGTGTLILYSLNDEGYIRSIDFPYDNTGTAPVGKNLWEKDNSLHLTYSTDEDIQFKSHANTFSGFAPLDDSAIVFCIPPNGDEEYYIIKKAADLFVNSSYYKIKAYDIDVSTLTSHVYVLDQFANDSEFFQVVYSIGESSTDNVCYVSGFRMVLDKEDDAYINEITYYSGGAMKSVLVPDSIMSGVGTLNKGDALRINIGENGYALNIVKLYDFVTGTLDENNTSTSYSSTMGARTGYVEKKSGTYFKLTGYDEVYNAATANVYIYDSSVSRNPITVGSPSDILGANDVAGGSEIVVNSYAGKAISILVIK